MGRAPSFEAGIVYAAGWLVAAHNEDGLAEELLESAGLTTVAACRAAGAEPYDFSLLRPVFRSIKTRERNLARSTPSPAQGGDQ